MKDPEGISALSLHQDEKDLLQMIIGGENRSIMDGTCAMLPRFFFAYMGLSLL